jgi:transcriptional regulator GlxA family with amidase domain
VTRPASCPVTAVFDVLALLRTGGPNMAAAVLETLPAMIEGELRRVAGFHYLRGRADAQRMRRRDPERRRSRAPKRHEWLNTKLADPLLRARALDLLRLDDRRLDRVLAGTVGLSPGRWRQLKRELER